MAAGLGNWYVEVEKQAYWRGNQHYWVNRYVLSGSDPLASEATTVCDALIGIEEHIYPSIGAGAGVGFVEARAYPSTGGPPLVTVGVNPSKVPSSASGFTGPTTAYTTLAWAGTLENCIDIVTPCVGLSTTGKPVQLRKYMRGFSTVLAEDTGSGAISSGDMATINANVAPWFTGIGPSSRKVIAAGGRNASGPPTVQKYLGNHQVPRGRKRSKKAVVAAAYGAGLTTGTTLGAVYGASGGDGGASEGGSSLFSGNTFIPIDIG